MRPSLNFKDQLGSSHETEKIVRREPSECSWLTTALPPRIILLCPVEAYPNRTEVTPIPAALLTWVAMLFLL